MESDHKNSRSENKKKKKKKKRKTSMFLFNGKGTAVFWRVEEVRGSQARRLSF